MKEKLSNHAVKHSNHAVKEKLSNHAVREKLSNHVVKESHSNYIKGELFSHAISCLVICNYLLTGKKFPLHYNLHEERTVIMS